MACSVEKQPSVREERYERITENLQLVPEKDGNGFSVSLQAFKYDDFNRAGLISLPKLCKYFESFRYVSWKTFGLNEDAVWTTFMIRLHVEISKELYKRASLASKVEIFNKLVHFGTSSLTFQVSLTDEKSGVLMASAFRCLVRVNPETRKSEPLAHEFRQKLTEILNGCQMKMPPKLLQGILDTKGSYCCTIVVKNMDMDNNNHTTNVTYYDYVLECAARAAEAGHYTKLKGDICGYCVKMANLEHTGESHAGDELLVMTNEDPSNPLLLHFSVAKKNRYIAHAMLEYYDPHIESNL